MKKIKMIASCSVQGGEFEPPNAKNPIRFYSDGSVEDEFIFKMNFPLIRPKKLNFGERMRILYLLKKQGMN